MTFVEKSCVVFDYGSYETKFGHGGSDLPSFVTNSQMYEDNGHDSLRLFKASASAQLKQDNFDSLLEQGYKYLGLDKSEHSLMIPDAPDEVNNRADLMERLFEIVPNLYFCCRPVLSTFQSAKTNALVVDIGHEKTSVCAVHEGYHIKKSYMSSPIAGKALSEYCLDSLKRDYNYEPYPSLLVEKKPILEPGKCPNPEDRLHININDKVKHQLQMETIHIFKEHVFSANLYNPNIPLAGRPFEFPDGFNMSFTREQYVPEMLFNGSPVYPDATPLIKMIQTSYDSCDNECKTHLPGNIVLTGGTSSIPGVAERLEVISIYLV